MSTTTIRLDDDLKERISAAAERAGKSPHAFLLEVIEQSVAQDEQRAEFHAEAARRWKKVMRTGETVRWDDARQYVESRAAGRPLARPRPAKSGR